MQKRGAAPTAEDAAALAISALGYLAEDGPRLGRFMTLTGMGPDELRAAADEPETLLAILDHLMSDESLLLVFTASKGLKPEGVAPARAALARSLGAETSYD
jgi:hypothetical protein